MGIFTCDACRYTFAYPQLPSRCPDCGKTQCCGKQAVRVATAQEIRDYYRIKAEIDAEDKLLYAANL